MSTDKELQRLSAVEAREDTFESKYNLLRAQERRGEVDLGLAAQVYKRRPCPETEAVVTGELARRQVLTRIGSGNRWRVHAPVLRTRPIGPRKARHATDDGFRRWYTLLLGPGIYAEFPKAIERRPGVLADVSGEPVPREQQLDLLRGSRLFHVHEPFREDCLSIRFHRIRCLSACGLKRDADCGRCRGLGTIREPAPPSRTTMTVSVACPSCEGLGVVSYARGAVHVHPAGGLVVMYP